MRISRALLTSWKSSLNRLFSSSAYFSNSFNRKSSKTRTEKPHVYYRCLAGQPRCTNMLTGGRSRLTFIVCMKSAIKFFVFKMLSALSTSCSALEIRPTAAWHDESHSSSICSKRQRILPGVGGLRAGVRVAKHIHQRTISDLALVSLSHVQQ